MAILSFTRGKKAKKHQITDPSDICIIRSILRMTEQVTI